MDFLVATNEKTRKLEYAQASTWFERARAPLFRDGQHFQYLYWYSNNRCGTTPPSRNNPRKATQQARVRIQSFYISIRKMTKEWNCRMNSEHKHAMKHVVWVHVIATTRKALTKKSWIWLDPNKGTLWRSWQNEAMRLFLVDAFFLLDLAESIPENLRVRPEQRDFFCGNFDQNIRLKMQTRPGELALPGTPWWT